MRRVVLSLLVVFLAMAVPASARVEKTFPRERLGSSLLVTSGGGVVSGDRYVTKAAVIAWSRKWNTLTAADLEQFLAELQRASSTLAR